MNVRIKVDTTELELAELSLLLELSGLLGVLFTVMSAHRPPVIDFLFPRLPDVALRNNRARSGANIRNRDRQP